MMQVRVRPCLSGNSIDSAAGACIEVSGSEPLRAIDPEAVRDAWHKTDGRRDGTAWLLQQHLVKALRLDDLAVVSTFETQAMRQRLHTVCCSL